VSAYTLLQRAAADEIRGRVFGVLDSLVYASIAVGGVGAAALTGALGIRGTLVAGGLVLPVLVVATWQALSRLDARLSPSADLELLRAVPMFAPLGAIALEGLAAELVPRRVAAGQDVIRQGEPGEELYVIAGGRADVVVDGRPAREEGPGDTFGEIALLRDAPRSATVRAATDLDLRVLRRDAFLAAVTGHADSAAEAEALAAARLARARPAAMARL
jgi:Cyclic nucleotide-binding domain